jgi:hypothetical protein
MRSYTLAYAALAAALAGLVVSIQVHAGADQVAFPDKYDAGVMYLTMDKADTKQVHQIYGPPGAIEAARKDQPMPSGTVLVVVRYAAQVDAAGNPVKGPDGHFIKDKLLGYAAMEKRTGWGSEYPEALRNGEWEYRAFTADKKPNDAAKLTACFECHKPMASHDFVHSYDKLKSAAR